MRKERKSKLEVSKVNVSKLNMIIAGDGSGCTIATVCMLCEITTLCDTNIDGQCKTYITATGSRDRC